MIQRIPLLACAGLSATLMFVAGCSNSEGTTPDCPDASCLEEATGGQFIDTGSPEASEAGFDAADAPADGPADGPAADGPADAEAAAADVDQDVTAD